MNLVLVIQSKGPLCSSDHKCNKRAGLGSKRPRTSPPPTHSVFFDFLFSPSSSRDHQATPRSYGKAGSVGYKRVQINVDNRMTLIPAPVITIMSAQTTNQTKTTAKKIFREEATSALAGFHAGPLSWSDRNLGENRRTRRKTLGARTRTNNKLNPNMTPGRN